MSRTTALGTVLLLPLLSLGPAAPGWAADDPCAAPTLVGTAADDELTGTAGPDVVAGLGGRDRIDGLAGDDVLCGGDEADVLLGGPGQDRLYGGSDSSQEVDPTVTYVTGDSLGGGPGDDLLDGGADPRHRGHDELDYTDSAAGVRVDLAARTATGEGTDTIGDSFSAVTGSAYGDVLLGTERADVLIGRAGADRVVGRAGNDELTAGEDPSTIGTPPDPAPNVLSGGPGRDQVIGGAGPDLIRGGADLDFLSGRAGIDRILGGPGRDSISDDLSPGGTSVIDPGGQHHEAVMLYVVGPGGRRAAVDRVSGRIDLAIGRLRGRVGDRVVTARLRDVHAVFSPQGRRWTVLGTPERDWLGGTDVRGLRLHGRGGDDQLYGSAHADLLDGGAGTDRGFGAGGRDVFRAVEVRR